MESSKAKYLVLPGPVQVRSEILEAQNQAMIGHRSTAFARLFESMQGKLRKAFDTINPVYIAGSSGTGLWEAACRNCIRDGKRVLHLVGGAFSERWAEISKSCGKLIDVINVDWGKAHTPEMVEAALKKQVYDAVCIVHNETSTGVTNPVSEIASVVKQYEDTLILLDTVSGFMGLELRPDRWGIDLALTSSQKAFAIPPGLAFASVSNRVLQRAKQVQNRGFYFDFLEYQYSFESNNTPSTPPVSLMFAADKQLDYILNEGIENRWKRHTEMRDIVADWVNASGLEFFAQDGYRSSTVTAVSNTKGVDIDQMAKFMNAKGFVIDKGYGKIKGKTFRLAHMGDMQIPILKEILNGLSEFLAS